LPEPDARAARQCVFCAIASGIAPARIVFEDEATLAFLDIAPAVEGHTLVIPRRHAPDLWASSADDAAAVMRTAHAVARRIRDVLGPEGLTLFQANRSAGWQDIYHLHVHVVPRHQGDGLVRPWHSVPADAEALTRLGSRLRFSTAR
jgi:histidine triad (HIT) family protein